MRPERLEQGSGEIALAAKVAFLGSEEAYPRRPDAVVRRETHMSWVFVAGDMAYKLKKPVRFSYLDFSTIERREAACRAELSGNRRLAPRVYLDVVPLTFGRDGMMIGGKGRIVDWLVAMRRLPEDRMLDQALLDGSTDPRQLERLAEVLAEFYRHATPIPVTLAAHLGEWRTRLAENRRVLFNPRFELDAARMGLIDRAQRRFLVECAPALVKRVEEQRIVDGHGDLRPEHICLGEPIAVIDRLEFNRRFRTVDPFDELASLSVECEQLGFASAGEYLAARVGQRLHDRISPALFAFYRCYRATLRARLGIAHLFEPDGRTPGRWPVLARRYLALALGDAGIIASFLDARRRRPRLAHRRAEDRPVPINAGVDSWARSHSRMGATLTKAS
jgi:aminoglycoside phosphotransferase family enzyme